MCCRGARMARGNGRSGAAKRGMRAEFVATPEEAGEWLARETRDGDAVLLKARAA